MKTTRWFIDERYRSYRESLQKLQVLSEDATLDLVAAVKKGDRDALHILATHNWRLILIAAVYYLETGVDLRDLMQDGYLQFLDIVPGYEPRKGPFSGYIIRGLRWRLPRGVSLKYRNSSTILFADLELDFQEDEGKTPVEELACAGVTLPKVDTVTEAGLRLRQIRTDLDRFNAKLERFPPYHQVFVRRYHGTDLLQDPLPVNLIAAEYSFKPRSVSDLIYQTLRDLRSEGNPYSLDWIGSRVKEARGIVEFLA